MQKIKFELSQDKYIIDETCYIFSYFDETFLCELNYEILNKNYLSVGFSNPPCAFVKEPFFDDLFADELEALRKINEDKKITQ